MPAKKPAARKKAAKKNPSPSDLTAVVPWERPVDGDSRAYNDPADVDADIEEQLALAENWQLAWELGQSGVSDRKIGVKLGVTGKTAKKWRANHQRKIGYSPRWEDERERQYGVLSALEQKLWREASQSDGTSWVAVANQIRAVMLDKRELMGAGKGEAPEGAAEATPGVGAAVALVTPIQDARSRKTA